MAESAELGITGLHSLHYIVHNPERSRTFYLERLGWAATWASGAAMNAETGQRSTVYEAGDVRTVVSAPEPGNTTCRAARYLRRHPAGVASVSFEVENLQRTWDFLLRRGGTAIHAIRETPTADGGLFRHFSITTALGDVTFRFLERRDTEVFAAGFERIGPPGDNPLGFVRVDHLTANAQTMASVALWMKHVLGFEQFWEITFHTEDVREGGETGTGLRSVVYWDPRSGLKFPINEPLAPFFKEGQINRFIEDNWGPGIQHVALEVTDVVRAVGHLRDTGVQFLDTPPSYYQASPERLRSLGVEPEHIAHTLDVLGRLGILIDGSPTDRYLIQIFLKDAMTLHSEPEAGPFFYELIQRCGDPGFGGGNFRALFEAIEREQLGQ